MKANTVNSSVIRNPTILTHQIDKTRNNSNKSNKEKSRMSWAVIASPQSITDFSTSRNPLLIRRCPLFPSNLNPNSSGLLQFPRINLRCNSSGDSAPFASDNESKRVIDAFFLGKAVGEVLNERIESSVGEFLSVIGRLQAEQRKKVSDLREEVLEKARRGKEVASREANGTPSVSNSVVSNEDALLGMLFKD